MEALKVKQSIWGEEGSIHELKFQKSYFEIFGKLRISLSIKPLFLPANACLARLPTSSSSQTFSCESDTAAETESDAQSRVHEAIHQPEILFSYSSLPTYLKLMYDRFWSVLRYIQICH